MKETEHLGNIGVDGRIILKIWYEDVNWINMAQKSVQQRVPVNKIMNLRVS
jgi:hypothetical protein